MDAPFLTSCRSARQRLPLQRLALAAAAALVCGPDLAWKATILGSRGATTIDTPTTLLRPLATAALSALALAALLVLPRLCLPGVALVLGGSLSNLASLALWRGVPDPLELRVGHALVHFNLADTCVWSGSLLFLLAAYWTLWRLPDAVRAPGRRSRGLRARTRLADPPP